MKICQCQLMRMMLCMMFLSDGYSLVYLLEDLLGRRICRASQYGIPSLFTLLL